jgi:sugar lactone lactonase YvrE
VVRAGLRRWISTAALGVTVLAVTGYATAPAQAGTSTPTVVTGVAPSLHPEGVTWDPTRGAWLVSSVTRGTVSVVRPDGSVRTLIDDPALVSTLGVRVDVARSRVLVVYADIGLSERSSSDTVGRLSGLGVFDLRTGRRIRLVDLVLGSGPHGANDVAFDRRGNAYVTDPASDTVYRVDRDGIATVLASDPRFASGSIGLNGIVWHRAGHVLVVRYDTGQLFRISIGATPRVTEVKLDEPLFGGDGLALRPDGTLVAVTNRLASSGVDAVSVLGSSDGWRTATRRHRVTPWPDAVPTTVTPTPYGEYVVSGQLDVLLSGGTSESFTLRQV